jgi:CubicO group peptidase (beta-lactamase class C family)
MIQYFKLDYTTAVKYFLIITFALCSLTPFNSKAQTGINKSVNFLSLTKFEGFYQLETLKDLYLQLKADGKHLKLIQLWDYKEKILIQTSESTFEDQAGFKLSFSKNVSDSITSMVANGRDIWLKDGTYKPEIIKKLNAAQEKALKISLDNAAEALIYALNSNSIPEIKKFVKAYASESLLNSGRINFEDQLTLMYRLTGSVERPKSLSFNPKAALSEYQSKGKYLNNIYDFSIKLDKAGKIKNFNNRLLPEPTTSVIKKGNKDFVASLKSVLSTLNHKDTFSGTVLLAIGDKVLFEFAGGEADKEVHKKITLDTHFNLGSMNKMFTALSIMQLIEKGKLNLNDLVSKYVDTTWLPKTLSDKITIHHLLSHTSGMRDIFTEAYENAKLPNSPVPLDTLAPYIKANQLRFEPGKGWDYSNAGMVLLGAVVQNVSGLNYYDYIRRYIYKPAGMTKSDVYDINSDNVAIGYIPQSNGSFQDNRNSIYAKSTPAGGGYSTAPDLHKFFLALNAGKLVSDSSKQKMFTDYMNREYGYGFQVFKYKNYSIIGHAGGAPGINAVAYMEPKSGYIVIILGNYDRTVSGISDFLLNQIKANLD